MPFATGCLIPSGRIFHRASLIAACCAALVAGCSHKEAGGGDQSVVGDLAGAQDLLPSGSSDMAQAPCGNGAIDANETCDDDNTMNGDGCSSTCQVEIGWQCPTVGMPCVRQVYCGDGYVTSPETCDDGNSTPGDGCSGTCQLEPNYVCATPTPAPSPTHEVCTSTIICGDGHVEPGEACDDGDTTGLNGCASDCSQVTTGYTCPSTGGSCMTAVTLCGNSSIDPGESCDDGNISSGDGCSYPSCQLEAGWTCPNGPGTKCQTIAVCGNGMLEQGEACDDSGNIDGDGCSSTCQIENGYNCTGTAGMTSMCLSYVICGDGVIEGDEQCDAGVNNDAGTTVRGCSATCTLDFGWTCPYVNSPCIAASCGDGYVAGSEICDLGVDGAGVQRDGLPGSGCSSTCTVTTGFTCTTPAVNMKGETCKAASCGNGTLEPPYEQCDDGNLIPYDGCSPTCTNEPKCSGGSCTGACGDGLKFPDEGCDDGNTLNGDGCSSTCQIEPGFTCKQPDQTSFPKSFTVPILYRDMIHMGGTGDDGSAPPTGTTANPDFNNTQIYGASGVVTGLVHSTLGKDGEPVFLSANGSNLITKPVLVSTDATISSPGTKGDEATLFCWWYHQAGCPVNDPFPADMGGTDMALPDMAAPANTNPYAKLVTLDATGAATTFSLTLTTPDGTPSATSVYKFSSASFFPIDAMGWNNAHDPTVTTVAQTDVGGTDSKAHNFSFTSELHYIFTYTGATPAPVFTFNGDDDVWAFINGHLVADIGGIHGPEATDFSYTLDSGAATTLGLTVGGWYSIDVFQAERHVSGSTYNLSLANFAHVSSVCSPICGDGVIEKGEACDNGSTDSTTTPPTACTVPSTPSAPSNCVSNNVGSDPAGTVGGTTPPGTTAYGQCSSTCLTRGPYCGDKFTETPTTTPKGGNEQCDDGINLTSYNFTPSTTPNACGPMCMTPGFCGDGTRQAAYDEQCDDGGNNGMSGDKCKTDCTLNTFCGDGVVNGSEKCDDGANNGVSGDKCASDCTFLCGNGSLDPGEACDDGMGNMASPGYQGCSTSCTLGGSCGDGIKNGPEQCDAGTAGNTGAYGGCTAMCTLAPYCGDGVPNGSEMCDQGSMNSQNAYGPNKCTTACQTAPYCGDGIVESSFGEKCDGGAGCNSMCMQTIQ